MSPPHSPRHIASFACIPSPSIFSDFIEVVQSLVERDSTLPKKNFLGFGRTNLHPATNRTTETKKVLLWQSAIALNLINLRLHHFHQVAVNKLTPAFDHLVL
ncbi:hypothetical protein L596_023883 [Steinernema carpocapsae]|uniref:Uncharacterized protein n=1 Tax=Steinernema carpocapsae TaxID=34508 RepID=A0A4U5MF20_STECR|nr:hypothetical protein L596_023883 [Steinernema carpocapsae]